MGSYEDWFSFIVNHSFVILYVDIDSGIGVDVDVDMKCILYKIPTCSFYLKKPLLFFCSSINNNDQWELEAFLSDFSKLLIQSLTDKDISMSMRSSGESSYSLLYPCS